MSMSEINSHPLSWPMGWSRTNPDKKKRSNFNSRKETGATTGNHLPPMVKRILTEHSELVEAGITLICVRCNKKYRFDWPHATSDDEVTRRLISKGWAINDPQGKDAVCPQCLEVLND